MSLDTRADVHATHGLVEALRNFPVVRTVEHCGQRLEVSPFEFYVICPRCQTQIKVRSFSGVTELEDVFDAVFEWMLQPGAAELVKRRQQAIREDNDE
jgi:hypothetical protein